MKNKRALSEVVSTLIILVISVLLAGVVTYYAINVVSTRVQEESLSLSDAHIWLNPTGTAGSATYSQASLKIINTGGRDVVITKVEIRGQDAAWSSYTSPTSDDQFIVYSTTNQPIGTDMYFQPNMIIPASDPTAASPPTQTLSLLGSGNTNKFTFGYATTDLVLASGDTMLIYIVNPDSITINDIGLTVSITIYTAQAMYYQECNVQAYQTVASGSS
jgi:hypothetical protein